MFSNIMEADVNFWRMWMDTAHDIIKRTEQCVSGVFNACAPRGERAGLPPTDYTDYSGIIHYGSVALAGFMFWKMFASPLFHNVLGDRGIGGFMASTGGIALGLAATVFLHNAINGFDSKDPAASLSQAWHDTLNQARGKGKTGDYMSLPPGPQPCGPPDGPVYIYVPRSPNP